MRLLHSFSLAFAIALCGVVSFGQKDNKPVKLTADELLSRHAASVGTTENWMGSNSRVMVGVGTLTSKVKKLVKMGGVSQIAASSDNFLLAMKLNSNDYPFEKFAFDGKDVTYGHFDTGGSLLSGFVTRFSSLLRHGVLGGVYRPNWIGMAPDKDIRLEYGGMTGGDAPLYKLKLSGRDFNDLSITMFFDASTFRHVKTEYRYESSREVMSYNPTFGYGGGGSQTGTYVESFSNFKRAGSLILPVTYTLEYQGPDSTVDWNITFSDVYFDQLLEKSAFRVS